VQARVLVLFFGTLVVGHFTKLLLLHPWELYAFMAQPPYGPYTFQRVWFLLHEGIKVHRDMEFMALAGLKH
jgi:4-hydroxybenzoate polyprenyltransferase